MTQCRAQHYGYSNRAESFSPIGLKILIRGGRDFPAEQKYIPHSRMKVVKLATWTVHGLERKLTCFLRNRANQKFLRITTLG